MDLLCTPAVLSETMRLALMLVATLAFASLANAGGGIIAAHGVRMLVPEGWQRIKAADPGPLTDPSTLLVVGTAGVLPKPRPARCEIANTMFRR
jgi:hypothetical protein